MWGKRNQETFRVFGLALAIALTPVLMQTEPSCEPTVPGETRLEVLKVSVDGVDMIQFDPENETYEVMFAGEPNAILIRAESMGADAQVSYNLSDGCEPLQSDSLPIGGGLFMLGSVPEGHSLLHVWVHAPGGQCGQLHGVLRSATRRSSVATPV
ncbi:MAG: hypothetical protein AMJ63_11615 [Myxococcales bacterium SG8_38_1]|jgi:hypothetical protein|nr:MAG: hypothetical protein AMJ63_11615 [Myxococcales bacterium SG8_38_1]